MADQAVTPELGWGWMAATAVLILAPLLSFLGFIIWFLVSTYGLPNLPHPHLHGDGIDFGSCHVISDGVGGSLNSCTYSDGHTEILKLSDSSAR